MADTQNLKNSAQAETKENSEQPEGRELSRIEKIAESNNQEINKAYLQRITFVKRGRDALVRGDNAVALFNYLQYFKAIANFFNKSPEEISPDLFDREKDVSECLMLSQVYWDLLHIFDRSEKTKEELLKYLGQFVAFSVDFKYQVVNSEILRKQIKKYPHHPFIREYQKAYEQMYVVSKKCYIATYCYGENHWVTQELRRFKFMLLKHRVGHFLVNYYYRYSPYVVSFSIKHQYLGRCLKALISPIIKMTSILSLFFSKYDGP